MVPTSGHRSRSGSHSRVLVKIGILGKGVVGSTCGIGFNMLGHTLVYHDPKLKTTIESTLDSDIVFVCVPTPGNSDGGCDTTLVRNVVSELINLSYQGVIAIKSTVTPGTVQSLIEQHNNPDICCVPEFLREHCALADFVKYHHLLAVGCGTDRAWHTVCDAHAWLPQHKQRLTPTEAEILKYMSNAFNATRVVFANVMYELCKIHGSDYQQVLNAYLARGTACADYMQCGPELRGYGGLCLPKDVKAMAKLCRDLGLPFELLNCIDQDNAQLQTTIFSGMRQ